MASASFIRSASATPPLLPRRVRSGEFGGERGRRLRLRRRRKASSPQNAGDHEGRRSAALHNGRRNPTTIGRPSASSSASRIAPGDDEPPVLKSLIPSPPQNCPGTMISTRRFALPAAVAFDAIGTVSPIPLAATRDESDKVDRMIAATVSARPLRPCCRGR